MLSEHLVNLSTFALVIYALETLTSPYHYSVRVAVYMTAIFVKFPAIKAPNKINRSCQTDSTEHDDES